jgi:transcriptional regulator with XRE-family HTH domain
MFRNLGRTLTLLREIRGKTQAQVARAAGIGKSQVSKYENSKELPKLDSLEKILTALGVKPIDLFSTLEMVDRRDGSLGKPEDPLAWLHSVSAPRSDVLPEAADRAFHQVMDDLLALHRVVLTERVCPSDRKKEKEHGNS